MSMNKKQCFTIYSLAKLLLTLTIINTKFCLLTDCYLVPDKPILCLLFYDNGDIPSCPASSIQNTVYTNITVPTYNYYDSLAYLYQGVAHLPITITYQPQPLQSSPFVFFNTTTVNCLPAGCEALFPLTLSFYDWVGYSVDCVCVNSTVSMYKYITLNNNPTSYVVINDGATDIQAYYEEVVNVPVGMYGLGVNSLDLNCLVTYTTLWPTHPNVTLYNPNPPSFTWVAILRKDSFSWAFSCNGSICLLEVPPDIYQTQGFMYIDIMYVPNICYNIEIQLGGEVECKPSNCIWTCPIETAIYFSCLPYWVQRFVLTVFILLLILIFLVVPFWVWAVFFYKCAVHTVNSPFYVYDGLRWLLYIPIAQTTGGYLMKGYRIIKYQLTGIEENNLLKQMESAENKQNLNIANNNMRKVIKGKSSNSISMSTSKALALSALIASGQAVEILSSSHVEVPEDVSCSFSVIATGSYLSCSVLYGITSCNTMLSVDLDLFIGRTTCISIISEDTGLHIGTIYLKLKDVIATVRSSFQYATSDYYIDQSNAQSCPSGGLNYQTCLAWAATNQPDHLPGESFPWLDGRSPFGVRPGRNYCLQYTAGNSCGGKKWAYDLARAVATPTGDAYSVYLMESIDYTMHVSVVIVDNQLTALPETILMEDGLATSINDYTFSLIGSYGQSTTIFPTNYFAIDGTNTSLAYLPKSVAPQGQPALGFGEIQSSSIDQLFLPTTRSFSYAPDIFQCSPSGNSFYCIKPTRTGAATFRQTAYPLPRNIGGDIWYYDGIGTIKANLTNPAAVKINFQTVDTGLSLQITSHLVCPKIIDVINATGCYNCNDGFVISITLISTCSKGFALLTSDDPDVKIANRDVTLDNIEEIIWFISATTTKSVNEFHITITDSTGKYNDVGLVKFIAFQYVYNDTTFNDGSLPNITQGYGIPESEGIINTGNWVDIFTKDIPNMFKDFFMGIPDIGAIFTVIGTFILIMIIFGFLFRKLREPPKTKSTVYHQPFLSNKQMERNETPGGFHDFRLYKWWYNDKGKNKEMKTL